MWGEPGAYEYVGGQKEQGVSEEQEQSEAKLYRRQGKLLRLTWQSLQSLGELLLYTTGAEKKAPPAWERPECDGEGRLRCTHGMGSLAGLEFWFEGCVRSMPNVGGDQIGRAKAG